MKEIITVRHARETIRDQIRKVRTVNDLFQLIHFWAKGLRPPVWISTRFSAAATDLIREMPDPLPGDTRIIITSGDDAICHQIDMEDYFIQLLERGDEKEIERTMGELARVALDQMSN